MMQDRAPTWPAPRAMLTLGRHLRALIGRAIAWFLVGAGYRLLRPPPATKEHPHSRLGRSRQDPETAL